MKRLKRKDLFLLAMELTENADLAMQRNIIIRI